MTSTSQNPRIHYTKPSITELEVRYANDAVANGWGEHCYDYINRFERQFSAHLNVKYAIATSSATGALHMGLAALGIGPGDEVILATVNWVASAAPITYLGAKPVFVDILPDTWCIDPAAAEAAITPRTKAILAVHLYGNLCNMDVLLGIAQKHGIHIVEDAAEAIGSVWHGKRAGSMGAFGAFSFHGTKTLTTGEGGMLVTNDRELFERATTLSNHGRSRNEHRQFWPERIGFKYKMSNVQAAIGCAQLERVQELIDAKRHIFQSYKNALSNLPLAMNPEPTGTVNGYWMPTIVAMDGIPFDRDALLSIFKSENIDGRVFFWPLTSTDLFTTNHPLPTALSISPRAVNLPSYHDLTHEELERVSHCITQHMKGY